MAVNCGTCTRGSRPKLGRFWELKSQWNRFGNCSQNDDLYGGNYPCWNIVSSIVSGSLVDTVSYELHILNDSVNRDMYLDGCVSYALTYDVWDSH